MLWLKSWFWDVLHHWTHCLDLDLNGKRPGLTSDGSFSSYLIQPFLAIFNGRKRRAALTGHGHPSPSWKIAKMALFKLCMKFDFLGPNCFIWCAMKSAFSEFIQNLSWSSSKCLFKWIKVDKLDCFKKWSWHWFFFHFGFLSSKTWRQNYRWYIFLP